MRNIVFAVAVQATEIDRRLCFVEIGIGRNNSIVVFMQSTSCGHLLELLACWDALQHFCIQLRLNAPQQTASLLNHLAGEREQGRHFEAERLGVFQVGCFLVAALLCCW
jgi:hypothetical protein